MSKYITINEMLDKLEKNKFVSLEKAIEYGLDVYSQCSVANYETGMAFALLFIGEAYCDMSKYEKAMTYLFDCINLSERQSLCDLQLLAYKNIGNIYFHIGEYGKSLEYYNSAEKLTKIISTSKNYYKSFGAEFYAAKIYNNIGEIYRVLRCYEDAIIYYNLSDKLDRELNYKATFGVALSNLGYVEYYLGNYDKALEYLNEAILYLVKNDYKGGIVEAYGIFALIHEKKGNYQVCERYFTKAIHISSGIAYDYGRIDLLIDYSKFLENIGKRKEAIDKLEGVYNISIDNNFLENKRKEALDKLEEAYNISIDNNLYAKTMEICKRTINLYEQANDINNANKYCKIYFKNEKKLENIEIINRAIHLKTKVKLESLEEERKNILEKSEAFRKEAEDLMKTVKNISIISELGEKLTTTLDLNQIYEMLYNSIQSFMVANAFGVAIYKEEKGVIEYQYLMENYVKTELYKVNFDNEASMAVKCLKENKLIIINDMKNEHSNYVDTIITSNNSNNYKLNSAIYCPLSIDNKLIGVITVQAYEKNSFTKLTIEMIKALSSYAAIAINNATKSINLLVEMEQRRKTQIQLENINSKLIHLSENDGLTDIPNRRKFDSIIEKEWNKAKERKSVISIIIFDIDCFKQYNDNYGHTVGDSCLISISNELCKSLVKNYFAARYGGDEFVIVLPDINLENAKSYGDNLRRNVEKLSLIHKFSKVKGIVTVTLGVSSTIPDSDSTIIDFIRQADNALYEAKNKGRNQIIGTNF
ncbi:MAG TPA: diguanylate cyclase [Clostridium sp.]|uniref:sensor domain-containing diguanylate cyclase n=1 Tax=Clostridium sp. TaxID=1506 RepID=UPI002F95D859